MCLQPKSMKRCCKPCPAGGFIFATACMRPDKHCVMTQHLSVSAATSILASNYADAVHYARHFKQPVSFIEIGLDTMDAEHYSSLIKMQSILYSLAIALAKSQIRNSVSF